MKKYLSQIILSVSILSSLVPTASFGDTVREPKFKGLLINSIDLDLPFDIVIRFSKTLEAGRYARLKSAYLNTPLNEFLNLTSAQISLRKYDIVAPRPLFLDVKTGYIVDNLGGSVGMSRFQQPNPDADSAHNGGFWFDPRIIKIDQRSQQITFNLPK